MPRLFDNFVLSGKPMSTFIEMDGHSMLSGGLKRPGMLIAFSQTKKKGSLLDQSLRIRSKVMKKGRNTAEVFGDNDELTDRELSDGGYPERTLVLKAEPPSRRLQLIAHGAKEIRCIRCDKIRPLARAEESEEGWICEGFVSEIRRGRKYGGQRGR